MNIQKAGMVSVIGRPNAGKSTLVNKIMGEKVAIVTPKPQTTRRRLCAVLNDGDTQLVLMDTPGFHKPRNRLGQYMVRVIRESVDEVDAVVLVVEPVPGVGDLESELLAWCRAQKAPVFLCVNKIDSVADKERLLPVIDAYRKAFDFAAILPVSARRGDGIDELVALLRAQMPEGPALFPEGMSTDQTERVLIAETIREQLLRRLDDEIPHGTAVVVEKLGERPNGWIDIEAVITCEKESHKGIIIGKKGAMLQSIGTAARLELEEMYEGKVNLKLWVRVREKWRDSAAQLGNLGFDT